MAVFNRIYFLGAQPVNSNAIITIRPADMSLRSQSYRWLRSAVQLPARIAHKIYTTVLMIQNQEIVAPVGKQIVQGRAIHVMESPTSAQHIITSARIANAILHLPRNEKGGLFTVAEQGDSVRLFLPLLKDLVADPANLSMSDPQTPVSPEDFLFTCSAPHAQIYRKAFLDFFGPVNLPDLRMQLDEVVDSAMKYLQTFQTHSILGEEDEAPFEHSARKLCGMFTVAAISRILLGQNVDLFSNYELLSRSIHTCMNYALMKSVGMTPTQEEEYQSVLHILRETINKSQGPFLDALNATELTDVQKKGVLFIAYIAGGETSTSVLEYMLWQIGQNPDLQNRLIRELRENPQGPHQLFDKVLHESLRLHPPEMIGRTPAVDLDVHVENPGGHSWTYSVPKGQSFLIVPYFTGRADSYENPTQFNPDRELPSSLPWNPFGRGFHQCPGKWLAMAEIGAFVKALLLNYEIKSAPDQPPRQKGIMTLSLDPEVSLILRKRKEF